jgi:hypothetical protein
MVLVVFSVQTCGRVTVNYGGGKRASIDTLEDFGA